MARYAITIFLSAFLLFQVQPLIGKFILPWFGGSPAVWSACMLFFQAVLLAGYSYAHLVTSRLAGRSQMMLHLLLLVGSLWFLPIAPDPAVWKQSAEDAPTWHILALLGATIGLPYFLLSSTGPLLQEDFRRATGRTPYRLYALSNVGSLLALLTYPFVFEPRLLLHTQIAGWSWAYGAFALCCGWCALGFARTVDPLAVFEEPAAEQVDAQSGGKPTWRDVLLWLSLAACGSVMLLATTNQLCQEVSAVPFLWVLPLALYLTTFIICFDHERWYHRNTFLVLLGGAMLLACYAIIEGNGLSAWKQLAIYSTTLWVCCMVCHGELVRAKPAAHHATLFYLMVSAGGALGGVMVALVAPLVLNDFWEYEIGLVATVVLAFVATFRQTSGSPNRPRSVWVAGGGLSLAVGLAVGWFITVEQSSADIESRNLETTRNFYGVLRVNQEESIRDDNGAKRELIHGRIEHGLQYLDEDKRRWPTTYYGHTSGVGLAINHHPRRAADSSPGGGAGEAGAGTLRIGVIGLGCGTLAAYGKPGDTIRFYEINPEVIRISEEYFTYRADSQAKVDVVLGDARVKMEQQLAAGDPQRFDVLAVDAFSSDSIPMHLLTRECAELFARHLKPDGLLCMHVSNRFLDLTGVVRGMAETLGLDCVRIDSSSDHSVGLDHSTWIIVTRNKKFLATSEVRDAIRPWKKKDRPPLVWTDDYGSLWQALSSSDDADGGDDDEQKPAEE